ncbi:MAG: hypothetical protein ACE5HI_14170 [bacterium]
MSEQNKSELNERTEATSENPHPLSGEVGVRCCHLIDGIALINLKVSGLLEMFTGYFPEISDEKLFHVPKDTKFTLLVNDKAFELELLPDYFARSDYDMEIISIGRRLSRQLVPHSFYTQHESQNQPAVSGQDQSSPDNMAVSD